MVQRQEAHAHAEPQRASARGDVGGEDRRRRAEAVVVEVVLGDPHRLIAEPFGGKHLLESRLVDGLLGPGLVALHQKEQAEIHSSPSRPAGDRGQDTSGASPD